MTPETLHNLTLSLADQLAAELLGAGTETYTTAPATEIEPLTFESLQRTIATLGPHCPPPVRLIEVDPIPIYGPLRRHKRRRIQKKWLKRYGIGLVGYEYPLRDSVIVDEKRGVGYCHPHTARIIRNKTISSTETTPTP